MARFTTQTIKRSDPAGDILQQSRKEKNLSLQQVSKRINVPVAYLEALEAGDWEALPKGDYGRYFLRQYARFLQLNEDELLKQYPGPNIAKVVQPPKHAPVNTAKTIHPLRRLILVLIALVVVVYLVIAARSIFLPPQLEIISPSIDGTSFFPSVLVSGITSPGTEVVVNNEAVGVTEEGRFTVSISLRPGLNTLLIKARKSLSREAVVERRIYYTPTKAEEELVSPTPEIDD